MALLQKENQRIFCQKFPYFDPNGTKIKNRIQLTSN